MDGEFEAPGARIAYSVHGEGAPLLLIAGIGYARWCWQWLLPQLSGYRVITMDNRCSGSSSCPQEPFDMSDLSSDCIALLDHLEVERCSVFGVSMGGFVAQLLALDHPDRVARLILGCTHMGLSKMAMLSDEALAQLSDRSGTPEEQIRRGMPFAFRPGWVDEHPDEFEAIVAKRLEFQPPPEIYMRQLAGTLTFDMGEKAAAIVTPTLVLQGTGDRVVPPDNARLIAETIPGARLEWLDGAGHLFFIEEPARVGGLIDEGP
ncbi:MAG TPA: alpha/beta fold hydrolase [Actinomycetota bacterium]|nr:alpha/beta fold hydrolase [Actinomycetota bacterium]